MKTVTVVRSAHYPFVDLANALGVNADATSIELTVSSYKVYFKPDAANCLHPASKLMWYDSSLHCFECDTTWHDHAIIKAKVPQAGEPKLWGKPDSEENDVVPAKKSYREIERKFIASSNAIEYIETKLRKKLQFQTIKQGYVDTSVCDKVEICIGKVEFYCDGKVIFSHLTGTADNLMKDELDFHSNSWFVKSIVRIRITDTKCFITYKGTGTISRPEFEFEIARKDAEMLLEKMTPVHIIKRRYTVEWLTKEWVLDVFERPNDLPILAEIELASETEKFQRPEWIEKDVTNDPEFTNAAIAKKLETDERQKAAKVISDIKTQASAVVDVDAFPAYFSALEDLKLFVINEKKLNSAQIKTRMKEILGNQLYNLIIDSGSWAARPLSLTDVQQILNFF